MNDSIASRLFSKNTMDRINKKINYLNLKIEAYMFCSLRVITTVTLFIILLAFKYGLIFLPLVVIIYYYLFEYIILDIMISYRKSKIENAALDFFPIFLISMNSGRNIKKAIELATAASDNVLSLEFKKVLCDVKNGKSLDESLTELIGRIPSDIVCNMIVSILESNRMGNNLNKSINYELEYLRTIKKNKLLKKYKTIPLQLLISCLFFTISIFILAMIFVYFC